MSSYNGLLYIFNREEKLLSILNNEAFESDVFFDDEFKKELNGEWSYKFSVDMSKTKDLMLEYNKVGFYDRRGNFQLFVIHDIEDNIGYEAIRTVYCLHDFQSLNENIIEEGKVVGNAKTALNLALKGSDYLVGTVSDTEEQVKDLSMITVLEAINSIAETYGLEVYYRLELDETKTKIAKRYIDLVEMLGEDTGLTFNFGLNIESIKRKINNNFFTVLYGRGKQLKDDSYANFSDAEWTKGDNPVNKPKGQLWVADEDAITKYGVRKGIYSNQNISSAGTLLKRTWEKLQKVNRPKINYEASVYELSSITGYEDLKINLGDRFNILDEEYNINEIVRVIAEYESILDITNKKVELGDPLKTLTDGEDSDDSYIDPDDVGDGEGDDSEVEGEDTLPEVPIVTAEGYFATVSVSWTFENKSYYTYELYASDVRGFTPTKDDKLFEGKASAFLHEVEPSETWYYKVRAKNGHGRYTDFSKEVSAETLKIADGAKYFESAAIKDALIGDLRLDRGWIGKLNANLLDVKGNFSVTDSNGKRTLDIDSFGNVYIDAKDVKMNGNTIDLNGKVSFSDLSTKGGTVINGDNISTGTITADKIATGTITVDKISSNNENPIIRLFDNCSIDATKQYGQGKGNAIRLKMDNENYIKVTQSNYGEDGSYLGAHVSLFSSLYPGHEVMIFQGNQYWGRIWTTQGIISTHGDNVYYGNNGTTSDARLVKHTELNTVSSTANTAKTTADNAKSRADSAYSLASDKLDRYSTNQFESGSHDPYYSDTYNLGWSSYRWQQVACKYIYATNTYAAAIDNPVATINDNSIDDVLDDIIIESPNVMRMSNGLNEKLVINVNALKENKNAHLFVGEDDGGNVVVNESSLLALALLEIQKLKQEIKDIKKIDVIEN